MMTIYLPIAEMPVNILLILGLGGVAGILSGMFGIGGGFLMTPLLMFIGIPPAVAVATSSNQIIAASVSGFLAHWRRQNVDIQMGVLLLIGGLIGSTLGAWIFRILKELGQIDLVISVTYVVFLGTIGVMMLLESSRAIVNKKKGLVPDEVKPRWGQRLPLPFKMHFEKSNIEVSAILPVLIGIVVGIMVAIMGIGGGFFAIPAMIYLLGMPTGVVIGTSLFQIIFTSTNVTILHAINTQTVDVVLALLLLLGAVVGAQFGTRLGSKLPAERLRILLAGMVILVCARLAFGLFVAPENIYTIEEVIVE